MKKIVLVLLVVFISLFFVGGVSAQATEYHVAIDGNDTDGDGSLENPWRTPEFGSTKLEGGDVLRIHSGTYYVTGHCGTADDPAPIEITASGTVENPTTITNYEDDEVILDGGSFPTGVLIKAHGGVDNILISNLKIKGVLWFHGYAGQGYINNLRVQNCDLSVGGDLVTGYNFGVVLFMQGVRSSLIKNNLLHDNGFNSEVSNSNNALTICYSINKCIFENNEFYNASEGAVLLKDSWDNCTLRYNMIHDIPEFGFRGAVQASTGDGSDNNSIYQNILYNVCNGSPGSEDAAIVVRGFSYNTQVYNNVIHNSGGRGAMCFTDWNTTSTASFWNNIVVQNSSDHYVAGALYGEFTWGRIEYFDHNIYSGNGDWYYDHNTYSSLGDWQSAQPVDGNSLYLNPSFTDPPNHKYTLQAGSPALTLGIDRQDHDNDGNTTERIPAGAYITGDEIIGYVQNDSNPVNNCSEGQINETCYCNGILRDDGFCCTGIWDQNACRVFYDDFESGNFDKWAIGVSESIVSNNCRTGMYCSETDFTAATDGKRTILAPPPTDDFYVSFYIKIGDDYHVPYLGFKWMRLKHGNVDGIQTEFYLNSETWYSTGLSYQTGTGGLDSPNTGWSWNPSFNDGQWHHVEVYVKYNTGGDANGICRIWFDSTQRIDDTNYTWRTGEWSSDVFASFGITSNAGDGTHHATTGDIIFIDDVEIWDGMPNQTDTIHKSDLNGDGVINLPELMAFIARWKVGDGVSRAEVLEVRDIWFAGGGY